MGKSIVCCTSTGCLDYYEGDKHNIHIIRIKLELDGEYYKDGTEMTADNFFPILNEHPGFVPKTVQAPASEILEQFNELYEEGYDEVFVCTISACMSGTINSVVAAGEMMKGKMKVVAYDTKTVCFNEGIFALRAAELLESGMPIDDVPAELDKMRANNYIMFAVEHLDFLIKNGRLSNAAGFFANLLNIKPLLEVQPSGEIVAVKKIRKIQEAIHEVAVRTKEYIGDREAFVYITETTDERVPLLKKELKEVCGLDDVLVVPCSPIVGCHVGNGALGTGIFIKYDK